MSFFRFKTHLNPQATTISIVLALFFGLATLLTLIITGVAVAQTQKANIISSTEGGLHFLAQAYALNVKSYLSEQKQKLDHFSKDAPFSNQKLLTFLVDNEDDFEAVFVVDSDNIVSASTVDNHVGKELSDHLHESRNGKTIVTDVHYSDILEKYTVDFISPLYATDNNEELNGSLVATLSIEKLAKIAHPAKISGDYVDAYLTDNQGVLLTPSKYLKGDNKGVLTQHVGSKNVEDCLQANFDFNGKEAELEMHTPQVGLYSDFRGEKVIGTHEHIIDPPWCLIIEGDEETIIEQPVKQVIQTFLTVGSLLLIVSAVGGLVIGQIIIKQL